MHGLSKGARSKDITAMAYCKLFDVTEWCKESKFLKQIMPGYKQGWIRHGYFEFTKPEDIKFHQRIIVMKKVRFILQGVHPYLDALRCMLIIHCA